MTDLQAIQLFAWFALGYVFTGLSMRLSDYIVGRYHRRERENGQKMSTKVTENT